MPLFTSYPTPVALDKESQIDVNNLNRGDWPRGEEVSIEAGQLSCKLKNETYTLEDSYKYTPHLQFMNLASDKELRRYVCAWGPLRMSDAERRSGIARMPIDRYWSFHRWLRSFADLLRAFHDRKREREYLRKYLQAAVERQPGEPLLQVNEMVLLHGLFTGDSLAARLAETGTLRWEDWLEQADVPALRKTVAFLIQNALPVTATIKAVWKGGPPRLRASWCSDCLEDAIEWMVLQDALDDKMPRFCSECGKAFRPISGHHTKFCGYECGHRVAARKWARKQRRV
jgi:hypothetical protein